MVQIYVFKDIKWRSRMKTVVIKYTEIFLVWRAWSKDQFAFENYSLKRRRFIWQ